MFCTATTMCPVIWFTHTTDTGSPIEAQTSASLLSLASADCGVPERGGSWLVKYCIYIIPVHDYVIIYTVCGSYHRVCGRINEISFLHM